MTRPTLVHAFILAVFAATLLYALSTFSGQPERGDGLGWDGVGYAEILTDGWSTTSANLRARPLVLAINEILYYNFFEDPLSTFRAANLLYAGVLAFFLVLLLREAQASLTATYVFVLNIAICIATAKMFAFNAALVDLGAYAFVAAATYFIVARRPVLTAVTCILAVLSREFGMIPVLMGVWRAVEERAGWRRTLATYLPPVLVFVSVRHIATTVAVSPIPIISFGDLLGNSSQLLRPDFWPFFIYFTITVFGGVSTLLCVTPLTTARIAWQHREVLAFVAAVIGIASLHPDMWRYLAYAVPGVALLFAHVSKAVRWSPAVWIAVTVTTVLTQRPWQAMNDVVYFRDWFPYYEFFFDQARDHSALWSVWIWRFALLGICSFALRWAVGFSARQQATRTQHIEAVV
jgi:hypothetical protein